MNKTLFQRLNPDVLIKIYSDQSELPNLTNSILKELHTTFFISEITLTSALSIFRYSKDTPCDFNEGEFYKLFN